MPPADQRGLGDACRADLRRIEDAGYGLRWLEVAQGPRLDLSRSLVPQLSLALLDPDSNDELRNAGEDSVMSELVALRLEDRDDREHSFDIDELDVHAPVAIGQTSLALFMPGQPGAYTLYCNVPVG